MRNEDFDLTAYLDGFRVTYRGRVIWEGNTWTGACRAMTAAREAVAGARQRKEIPHMAAQHSSIHLYAEDKIGFGQGGSTRWLKLGEDLAVFCSDEKLAELRHAIDAHLANRFAMVVPAPAEAEAA